MRVDDPAVVLDIRGPRQACDRGPEHACCGEAAGQHRAPASVKRRRDAVCDGIASGLDGGQYPCEPRRLPGRQTAERPSVGVRGSRATGAVLQAREYAHAGGRSMIQTGRERLASPGCGAISVLNGCAAVP